VAPTPIDVPPIAGGDVRAYEFVSADEMLFDGDLVKDEAYGSSWVGSAS
jgi:hypothetical protein